MEIRQTKSDLLKKYAAEWRKADLSMGMHWNKKTYHFELRDGGKAVGYTTIITNGGVGELKEIIVGSKHRGKGYGDALMDHYVAFCRRKGCHKLVLNTSERHKAATRLYRKHGFRVENVRQNDRYHVTWYVYSRRIK